MGDIVLACLRSAVPSPELDCCRFAPLREGRIDIQVPGHLVTFPDRVLIASLHPQPPDIVIDDCELLGKPIFQDSDRLRGTAEALDDEGLVTLHAGILNRVNGKCTLEHSGREIYPLD